MNESINAQSQALFMTALYTGYRALETGGKAIFGSNSTSSRSDLWKSASKQETHLSALSNRCQVVFGSDSLTTRVTNLAKSAGFGLSTMFSLGLLGVISENQSKLDEVNAQLATCNGNLKEKAELEIEKGQAQGQLDNCKELLDACTPQLQKYTQVFKDHATALAQKAQLDTFTQIFATTTDAENAKKGLETCNSDKTNLQGQFADCNLNLINNARALAQVQQANAQTDSERAATLAAYQALYPTIEEAKEGVTYYTRCSGLLQEKSEQQRDVQGQLDTCNSDKGDVQAQLDTCNSDKGDVQAQLGTCKTAAEEASKAKQRELDTCNSDKGDVQAQLDTCKTAAEEASKAKQRELDTCNSDKVDVQAQLETAEQATLAKQRELDTCNKDLASVQTEAPKG